MSPAASCKSRADLRNSGLSNITQVHNIINPVNNTKASETLIFFPLQNSLMLLHDCYKGSSLPCNPGPHSSCACNSSWLRMHSSRYRAPTTHTQKLWSEINLKGFFSSFCCASQWLEAILHYYFCYTIVWLILTIVSIHFLIKKSNFFQVVRNWWLQLVYSFWQQYYSLVKIKNRGRKGKSFALNNISHQSKSWL